MNKKRAQEQEFGEEIVIELRGYICRIRRVDEGWLSLIIKQGHHNPVVIAKATPNLLDAINKAVRQVLRMAPSVAISEALNDLYAWGHLSKEEQNNLHYSFHNGMRH